LFSTAASTFQWKEIIMQGQSQNKSGNNHNPQLNFDQTKEKIEKGIKDLEQRFDNPEVNQDFKALKSDIGLLKETAEQKAQEAADRLKGSGDQVGKQVLDAVSQYKDKGGELAGQLEHQVHERPLVSLLVAFGLGMMFTRMRR
jgi:ElaB/YqjD/DUF883 family membrane-anchored ribosome-binding protein